MNICLTSRCNQACPYCFSADRLHSRCAVREFRLADLAKVLDYYVASHGTHHINLYGGEPTQHSKLPEVLELLFERGFALVRLFSNGIISDKVADLLESYGPRLGYCWNINPPELYSPQRHKRIQATVRRLTNGNCSLGFNIYHTEYRPDFALEVLEALPILEVVRVGIAHPINCDGKPANQSIVLGEYPQIGSIIHDFILEVKRRTPQVKHVHIDCGYAPCLFTPAQHEAIQRTGLFSAGRCSDMSSMCVVLPTLQLASCFSSGDFVKPLVLSDFASAQDASAFLYHAAEAFSMKDPNLAPEACRNCRWRKECDGGCSGEKALYARAFLEKTRKSKKGDDQAEVAYSRAVAFARLRDYDAAWAEWERAGGHRKRSAAMRQLGEYLETVRAQLPKDA